MSRITRAKVANAFSLVGYGILGVAVALGCVLTVLRYVVPVDDLDPLFRATVTLMLNGVSFIVLAQTRLLRPGSEAS